MIGRLPEQAVFNFAATVAGGDKAIEPVVVNYALHGVAATQDVTPHVIDRQVGNDVSPRAPLPLAGLAPFCHVAPPGCARSSSDSKAVRHLAGVMKALVR
jgi:hypothetical protein